MTLFQEFHHIVQRVGETVAVPQIEEVLLPSHGKEEGKQDEFGFLLLADGSVGPFYTSFDNSLQLIQQELSRGLQQQTDPVVLASKLGDDRLHINALALGALNAISQFLMRRSGFDPTAAPVEAALSEPAGRIGMVGYFGSVTERYLAQGYRITLVEKNPARVPAIPGMEVSTEPAVLAGCDYILCTASTLINNTLWEILNAVSPATVIKLMGPSASCLPDPLFARGVDLVAGIMIDDPECLRRALSRGESWGGCGKRYQLSSGGYPGWEALLARCRF
ncbi:MAG: hypothetical protein H6968_05635 [Chromatiaceae bacterium]|nr:hypothetical protein [Chromatiaceae bacterium]MCP5442496.1 hypothetical protein [Chromatiaceae bacterium]